MTDALKKTISDCDADNGKKISDGSICDKCRLQNIAINRYAQSNIPISYWSLSMEEDFHGFDGLLKKYNEVIIDIQQAYSNGISMCFAGSFGTGKTLTAACILKKAALVGYSCLYTTLADIVNLVGTGSTEDKFSGRKELMQIDFLVIDEFDSRWMSGEKGVDFFGRTLEDIFRSRLQNKLPTFMCTNSPNPVDSFTGSLKKSIGSLMKKMEIVPVLGSDYRGNKTK